MDDHDFHEALKDISNEPIPYFTQFGDCHQILGQQSPDERQTKTQKPPTPPLGDAKFIPPIVFDSRPSSSKSEALAVTVDDKAVDVSAITPSGTELIPIRSQTQSSGAPHTEADYLQSLREERKRMEQQTLKR